MDETVYIKKLNFSKNCKCELTRERLKMVSPRAVPRAGPAGPRPEAPRLGKRKF